MQKRSANSKTRRGTIRKTIETSELVAIFEVPVIYAPEMPREPLLESKTVKFLDEARRRAKSGDKKWLKKRGAAIFVGSPAA